MCVFVPGGSYIVDSLILGVDKETPFLKKCSQAPRRGGIGFFLQIGACRIQTALADVKGKGRVAAFKDRFPGSLAHPSQP